MKKTLQTVLLAFILMVFGVVCFGQMPNPTPETVGPKDRRGQKQYEPVLDVRTRRKTRVLNKNDRSLRYPSKKELAIIAPDKKFTEQYKEVLKGKRTGLTKMISGSRCGSDSRVLVVNTECLQFKKIPAYGSGYSFRVNRYATENYSDVVFSEGVLYSSGKLTFGFITNLGDIAIENVTNLTDGAEYVYEFVPSNDPVDIEKQKTKFAEGIKVGEFEYRDASSLTVGNTYLLRSVSFRFKRTNFVNGRVVIQNSAISDKRRDIVLTFRVVEIDEEGSVTLLWKILRNNKAPKIIEKKSK